MGDGKESVEAPRESRVKKQEASVTHKASKGSK
jgi:hypothetical protein